ncbi:hypothetical protein NQ314_013868 [Rhamnusium bicolor]|uniref:PiggyBac transposable element-derived protein domain-containing protein n=1 Tax=Rhamnusium bicolor TaxID=1586634 RepID=A0AAV8X4I0_9CUCU|nr:hypothetical protein NQ314_013868 [Rhamnusium bicolor]
MEIYVGKQPEGPYEQNISSPALVKRLIQSIAKTWRNVTGDNFFVSVPLAEDLLTQEYQTTLVGTLRKNKREIPPLFVQTKDRAIPSSIFRFGMKCLLVSYVPKKNKNVLLLSTMHEEDIIDENTDDMYKPEVITFYNKTKSDVDVVDKLKSLYSVSRISCRWPLRIFFSLMDIADINSNIIYFENTKIKIPRRKYFRNLRLELVRPHEVKRAQIPTLPVALRIQIRTQLGILEKHVASQGANGPEKCAFCSRSKNRKMKTTCCKPNCSLPICREHSKTICTSCWNQEEDCKLQINILNFNLSFTYLGLMRDFVYFQNILIYFFFHSNYAFLLQVSLQNY